jgi:hypothetical protein
VHGGRTHSNHFLHTKIMAISVNHQIKVQQFAPTDRLEVIEAQGLDAAVSNIPSEFTIRAHNTGIASDEFVAPNNLVINQRAIEIPRINETLRNGIDIDQLTGVIMDHNRYMHDYWSAADMMESTMRGIQSGMIGGFHWSQFAECGTASNVNKAAGIAVEAYECSADGMTRAWNHKEQQLLDQTGDSYDLNGDGYVGDAPTGDDCDGDVSFISWLYNKAKDVLWDEDDDESDDDSSDTDECFEKPWLNEQYFAPGSDLENYGQDVPAFSSQMLMASFGMPIENYSQDIRNPSSYMQMPDFGVQQQAFYTQTMPIV